MKSLVSRAGGIVKEEPSTFDGVAWVKESPLYTLFDERTVRSDILEHKLSLWLDVLKDLGYTPSCLLSVERLVAILCWA